MKGFLVFCGVLSTIALVGIALPYLLSRDRVYEQRLVGALDFTEKSMEAALGGPAEIYKPAIAAGSKPGHWTLSGIVVSKDELDGEARARFVANLQSLCADAADSTCWQTVELSIDGRVVRPDSVAESSGDWEIDAVANAAGGPGDQRAVPAAAASPAVEAMPASTEDPIEATASLKSPPTPGGPEKETVSGRELVLFIQDALTELRYEPGPIDGKLGARTTAAIRAYQRDLDLPQDGRPTPELLRHLRLQLGDIGQQSGDPTRNGLQPSG